VTPDWFAFAAKYQAFAQRASENQRGSVNQRTYKSENLFLKINATACSNKHTNLQVFFENPAPRSGATHLQV
jgi:hypothetical protein